ncbi:uncharacterized protein M421DRAFT_202570 [Didymella exigua CBS 183.55]|uniref:Carbohydrate-binding module family 18 protein n=1 Tax=Didymella exigua CBS 183.55 TaxID=1150837 RepID=A0A6A5S248_9PLEO|nr:uncharacterized protein M421DRAFT_202570 [Didymella exigua CBS 183.55]KAF1933680.1 hypothetical protein M421DRAFT_202570 [Didymella exigua CBS 183.55]
MRVYQLFAATTLLRLVAANFGDVKRTDIEIDWNEANYSKKGFNLAGEPAAFLESFQGVEKNETIPQLQDRSTELYGRQRCQTGYGYCSAFGRCCPSSNRCCGYGYCLESGKTCCPNGPCGAGLTCCENKCMPDGASCCRSGNYCETGNMCVLYNGRGVCCTDLQCTAVVTGGTTSFARTATQAPTVPTITQPPRTTQVIADSFTTYYWTVRWRYYSYYWTIFQARSTVTYTITTYTTIYTTIATDDSQASALFADLSKTIAFSTPAEATTLASLLDAAPSPTTMLITALDTALESTLVAGPTSQDVNLDSPGGDDTTLGVTVARTSSSSTFSSTFSRTAASSSALVAGGGDSASAAGTAVVQMAFVGLAALSGLLMLWL